MTPAQLALPASRVVADMLAGQPFSSSVHPFRQSACFCAVPSSLSGTFSGRLALSGPSDAQMRWSSEETSSVSSSSAAVVAAPPA